MVAKKPKTDEILAEQALKWLQAAKKLREGIGLNTGIRTATELQKHANDYFDLCDEIGRPYGIAGLASYLGLPSTSAYSKFSQRPALKDTASRVKMLIEAQLEANVQDPTTKNSKGIEFSLTNNYGYKIKPDMTSLVTVDIQRPTKKDAGTPPKCGQLVISTDLSDINDLL